MVDEALFAETVVMLPYLNGRRRGHATLPRGHRPHRAVFAFFGKHLR
jgi:hypothetical protein